MAASVERYMLLTVLQEISDTLQELQQPWALIGGLAVSAQTGVPRFTQDVDLAVSVEDDPAAEALVFRLVQRGYLVKVALEQNVTQRMATVRLLPPDDRMGVLVDLLFASAGFENEVVASAEIVELAPGLDVPVARAGHLIAMKLLSVSDARPRDQDDLHKLLQDISDEELALTREAIRLMEERGNSRGKALVPLLEELLARLR